MEVCALLSALIVAVWHSGNVLVLTNKVALRWTQLSVEWVRACKIFHYVASNLGQLSLAIPPWVGIISIIYFLMMVSATAREENGEFGT